MVLKKKEEKERGAYQGIKDEPERKSAQRTEQVNHSSDLRLQILKALMALYGVITLPVYLLIQRPWTVWRNQRIIWAKFRREDDPYSPVERIVRNYATTFEGVSTLDELFQMSVFEYGNMKSFGAREVLDEIEEKDKSGKILKKLKLGDYHWISYKEVAERVNSLSKGFLAMGLKPKQPIAIFAETRREWFLTLQACVQNNIPVATLYANLGEEGIIHVINETEVSTIVCSQDLLSKLKKICDKLPTITKVIYMKNLKSADTNGFPSRISIFRLSEIERMGRNCTNVADIQPPCADDLALIMYTSGSTGRPKGVMISHENIIAMLTGSTDMAPELDASEMGMSFLPLAHVYGLIMEYGYIRLGAKYGYASPYTLLDKSLGLVEGCKGDMTILKPTIFTTVPLLLNRLAKGINEVVNEKGPFAKEFFTYAVEYKDFWWKKGFNSPILNRLVFHKVQQILGGQVKYMVSAGAPLSPDTQILIRTCFDAILRPSYGLTELAAAGTSAAENDYSTGRIGAPYFPCTIKFVDWEEGGYRATDKPNPRGELVLGGPCVTLGYYKNEELTNEVYKEEDGVRWFYTGDIGEMFPDGTFKIIDRKKDLHKLQRGEYVSLGKIEAEMKTSLLVDNICVVGSASHDHLVALVQPNEKQLRKLATALGSECSTFPELCHDIEIVDYVTNQLKLHGKTKGLLHFEIPQRFKLCYEEWLPESGLVTAALKLKRKAIEEFYKDSIVEMYAANSTAD